VTTLCKHCYQPIVKYSRPDTHWENIGDDDQWVHTSPHPPHKPEPQWEDGR